MVTLSSREVALIRIGRIHLAVLLLVVVVCAARSANAQSNVAYTPPWADQNNPNAVFDPAILQEVAALAESNPEPAAMFILGWQHGTGHLIPIDSEQAASWYTRAFNAWEEQLRAATVETRRDVARSMVEVMRFIVPITESQESIRDVHRTAAKLLVAAGRFDEAMAVLPPARDASDRVRDGITLLNHGLGVVDQESMNTLADETELLITALDDRSERLRRQRDLAVVYAEYGLRDRAIRTFRAALESTFGIDDVDEQVSQLRQLADSQLEFGDEAGAEITIEAVRELARSNLSKRDEILANLFEWHRRNADLAGSEKAAELALRPDMRRSFFVKIAGGHLQFGNHDSARKFVNRALVQHLPFANPEDEFYDIIDAAFVLTEVGDTQEAAQLLLNLRDDLRGAHPEWDHSVRLRQVTERLCRARHLGEALETAEMITDPADLASALSTIAGAYVDLGRPKTAEVIARRVDNPRGPLYRLMILTEVAATYARANDRMESQALFAELLEQATEYESVETRDQARYIIADQQLEILHLIDALATIETIEQQDIRDRATTWCIRPLIDHRTIEEAIALAESVLTPTSRSYACQVIYLELMRRGDAERATPFLDLALEACARIESEDDRFEYLLDIASACGRHGEVERAIALIDQAHQATRVLSNPAMIAGRLRSIRYGLEAIGLGDQVARTYDELIRRAAESENPDDWANAIDQAIEEAMESLQYEHVINLLSAPSTSEFRVSKIAYYLPAIVYAEHECLIVPTPTSELSTTEDACDWLRVHATALLRPKLSPEYILPN